jgi:hypothetical protein
VTQVVTQLFRDSTQIRFDSPVPFTGEGFVLVRLSGGPFSALPRRPSTAALVHDGATWHGTTLQLAADTQPDYCFNVRIPRLADTVGVVLSEVANQHRLSDKGKIGAALQASKNIAVLLQPGTYEAVVELTTPRAERLRRELHNLHAAGKGVDQAMVERLITEWGHRGERRYRGASQVSKSSAAALETLVDQQWAERGFEIACTNCGISTFVSMADVPTRGPAICGGCQSPQRYTLEKATPKVVYRLDALVDRASDQGVLPHLLVIAALTMQDSGSSLLPGVNLAFAASPGKGGDHEVDIFGVHQARILAGEVKTKASNFTPDQLARDIDLSKRVRADVHLLAAIDTVPTEIEAAARKLCCNAGLELLVLNQTQLRPGNLSSTDA